MDQNLMSMIMALLQQQQAQMQTPQTSGPGMMRPQTGMGMQAGYKSKKKPGFNANVNVGGLASAIANMRRFGGQGGTYGNPNTIPSLDPYLGDSPMIPGNEPYLARGSLPSIMPYGKQSSLQSIGIY